MLTYYGILQYYEWEAHKVVFSLFFASYGYYTFTLEVVFIESNCKRTSIDKHAVDTC
jgi:hypothetical protein